MEDIFKQNLLKLRNPSPAQTFAEALMGPGFVSSPMKPVARVAKVQPPSENFTEKKQVLESLERFAQEQVTEKQENVIKIDGGEILVKPTPGWEVEIHSSATVLNSSLSISNEVREIAFRNKKPQAVEVFFVTENFRSWEEIQENLSGSFLDELLLGFPPKTAELFERMIKAMKLAPEEVLLYPVEAEDKSLATEVMSIAAFYRPKVIVTLGALATNAILKGNDRLSLIHGEFFTRQVNEAGDFQVVPLFHPSIIESNQNMKKTAWSDMQKIMKYLKKLP